MKNICKNELAILWSFSVLLGFALIALQIKNKLPLGAGDFVFISILALCFALYRPRWFFYVFVSLIPLENVILTSGFLPLQLRPFQYTGVILAVAILILWAAERLNFKLLKPAWFDWLIFALVPLSFLSATNASSKNISLKDDLILLSFIALYFLIRTFLRTKRHLIEATLFFVGSNLVVLFYGFFQVFADKFLAYRQTGGARSFEVMFGRPNSTFTEPDWLGIFLCFALAVFFSVIASAAKQSRELSRDTEIASSATPPRNDKTKNLISSTVYLLIFLNLTLLILTLSRSAWIGAAAIVFFFLLFSLFQKKRDGTIFTPRKFGLDFATIFLLIFLSLVAVQVGHLSKFDIFDRARSTATSEQKITIACSSSANIPQIISNTDELPRYGCEHINLEDIEKNKARGKFVTEIFRKDPNVMTRSQIYEKDLEVIRQHPILGVGFGTITQLLGADERGAGLNESNVFLQTWAGSGILGLIALIAILGHLFIYSFRRLSPVCPLNKFFGCPVAQDDFERHVNIFLILGLFALIIPNLFNAGLFMGIFWLGLAILASAKNLPN